MNMRLQAQEQPPAPAGAAPRETRPPAASRLRVPEGADVVPFAALAMNFPGAVDRVRVPRSERTA